MLPLENSYSRDKLEVQFCNLLVLTKCRQSPWTELRKWEPRAGRGHAGGIQESACWQSQTWQGAGAPEPTNEGKERGSLIPFTLIRFCYQMKGIVLLNCQKAPKLQLTSLVQKSFLISLLSYTCIEAAFASYLILRTCSYFRMGFDINEL